MKRILTTILLTLYYQMIVCQPLADIFNYKTSEAKQHYQSGNLFQSLITSHEALELAWELDDREKITQAYMRIFTIQYKFGTYKLALGTVKKALEHSPDESYEHRNLYNMGLTYKRLHKYDSALIAHSQAYEYFLSVKDTNRVCLTLNEMGLSHYYAGNHSQARKYYHDLLDYSSHVGKAKYQGWALNNIGNSYRKQGVKDSAEMYLVKALEYNKGRHSLPTYLRLADVSKEPYQWLLAAKHSYTNELDEADYIRTLIKLREYHEDPDSINHYANLIANLTIENLNNGEDLKLYNQKLQVMEIEHQFEMKATNDALEHERNRWIVAIIILLAMSIGGFLIYKGLRRRSDERRSYMMQQVDYTNKELIKTLEQMAGKS